MVFMYNWNTKARLRRESVEKILVVHREESVMEDILELCHRSSCIPVAEYCGQCIPSQETSGGLFRQTECVLNVHTAVFYCY